MPEDTIKRVDYTPITQGLREYVRMHPVLKHTGLSDFLDNIDAVHKALETENAELRKELKERPMVGDAEVMAFVGRLSDAADKREDVDLWGVSYTVLPIDADGVPIHVWDVMKGEKVGGGFSEPFEVVGYIMSNGELEPMDEHKCPRRRKYLHHHHEPTVEDVLREMADRCYADEDEPRDRDAIVAEYAAKLRLAGDAE